VTFDLNLIWFVILGILLAGYAILDGFDLGVGMLVPLARNDHERRHLIAAVGPIWDGNEVWLVTFGGALFAAFPEAYATIFSGFYIVFMLVLLALISRAVSLEFRNQLPSTAWRTTWDYVFFGASLLATVMFGVGVGNAMIGVPLNERGVYVGGFLNLLNFYTLSVGMLSATMFLMHGALYLLIKTTGDLQDRLQRSVGWLFAAFVTAYLIVTILTVVDVPHATEPLRKYPASWLIVIANLLAIGLTAWSLRRRYWGRAFLASTATISAFVLLLGLALFPNLVASRPTPENSLTIYNAASSQTTLQIMLIIALIGMPFVITYTGLIYWIFRGKVVVGADH
jgi:cytochrome d ubiquinol oxidase subunit II